MESIPTQSWDRLSLGPIIGVPAMISRAFSLIELVLSIALMSTLLAVAISWASTAMRIQRDRAHSMNVIRSIEVLDRAIRVDLLQLDASAQSKRPRIEIDDQNLYIDTRNQGPRRVSYYFDPNTSSIVRSSGSDEIDHIATADSLAFILEHEPGSGFAVLRVLATVDGERHQFINHVPTRWIR